MKIAAGTSGFSYEGWLGNFYPADLAPSAMLDAYAQRLPVVEINNSFYRMPEPEVLAGWRERVPDTFRFALKASRQITQFKRLKDCAQPVGYLLAVTSHLGHTLGPVLFQLHPNMKKDLERLQEFLALLPEGPRFAFEFRHPSWNDPDVNDTLRARDIARVHNDDDGGNGDDDDDDDNDDDSVRPLVATASWGYLRLRRQAYGDDQLRAWVARIREQPWQDALVFFKHEDAGAGPKLAQRLMELAAS